MSDVTLKLSIEEARLIHTLMHFLTPSQIEEACNAAAALGNNEYRWGQHVRLDTLLETYRSLAAKLDRHVMMTPTVMQQ